MGLSVLLAGTSFLVRPTEYEAYDILAVERKVRAMKSEPDNSLDVLFLGDSESCDVYSPVQLWGEHGFTGYNTGSRAQRITDAYAILEQELERQNPKLIVLEVNALFKKDDLYNSTDLPEMYMEQMIPITHYHSFYKIWEIPEIIYGMNTEYAKASVLKGFWYRKTVVPYTGPTDYMSQNTKKVTLSPGSTAYLNKILALAGSKGISVLMIASPSPKNWTQGNHDCIADFAQQNEQTFIDLNQKLDEIGIDWNTDSLDRGDHVNFNGSKKINTYIGKILVEQYGLTDRRGDAQYQSWNDLYSSIKLYQ